MIPSQAQLNTAASLFGVAKTTFAQDKFIEQVVLSLCGFYSGPIDSPASATYSQPTMMALDLSTVLSTAQADAQKASSALNTASQVASTVSSPAPSNVPTHGQTAEPSTPAASSGLGTGTKVALGAGALAAGLFWWKRRHK